MGRLTYKTEKKLQKCGINYLPREGLNVFDLHSKLGKLEDAEEQGLLLRLPCKVGDTVYSYCSCFGNLEYEVDNIVMTENEIIYQCSAYSEPIGDCPSECLDEIEPDISDFGKTVFLTKEAAEQALKEGVKNGDE